MRDRIATLPDQLRWAAALGGQPVPPARAAVCVGVGGSAIAGDIASVVAAAGGRRVQVHRDFDLPRWLDGELVVAVSHSGQTAETLSCFEQARGARAVATTGGELAREAQRDGVPMIKLPPLDQPRAAVGHLAGAVLRLLEFAGIVPDQRPALEEAARVCEALLAGPGPAQATRIAAALEGRIVGVIGGAGLGEVAARRWKTQLNENAKVPAWWSQVPELLHNEVDGWAAHPELGRDHVGLVYLEDPGAPLAIARRLDLLSTVMGEVGVPGAGRVRAEGVSVLARLFSLIVLGDLVSVELAERAGVDPVEVAVIQDLKRRARG